MIVKTIGELGPCFGVDRAIDEALSVHESHPSSSIFFSHPLVHNQRTNELVQSLTGASFLDGVREDSIKDIPSDSIVLFSAHGHPYFQEEMLNRKNIIFFDSFCPLLKAKYLSMRKALNKVDSICLYVGKKSHQESIATMENFPSLFFIDSSIDISKISLPNLSNKDVYIFRQSTIIDYPFEELVRLVDAQGPKSTKVEGPCRFLLERFSGISKVDANENTLFVVVGDRSSSNANELLSECMNRHPYSRSMMINDVYEIKMVDLKGYDHAYVVSSTSALRDCSNEIISYLEKI